MAHSPMQCNLGPADLCAMDAYDGVNQVARLVDDDDLALQPHACSLPHGCMQQHWVGQHHQLEGRAGCCDGGQVGPMGNLPACLGPDGSCVVFWPDSPCVGKFGRECNCVDLWLQPQPIAEVQTQQACS